MRDHKRGLVAMHYGRHGHVMRFDTSRGMSGNGFVDTIKHMINRGLHYGRKAAEAYTKYKPAVEKAYEVYKGHEQYVPKALKDKVSKIEAYGLKHKDKIEVVNRIASQLSQEPPAIVVGHKPAKPEHPADKLKESLLNQIR